MLLFDRALLALGNILFLAGFAFLSGLQRTIKFFADVQRLRFTVPFLGGVCMVMAGWTITGMIVETFGFFNLFKNFFPVVLVWLRHVPFVGQILNMPGIKRERR